MPVWGFADLHAHPASHLGFGANERGEGGIFWGKPGQRLEDAEQTLSSDLPSCMADKHAGFDEDMVRHLTRQTLISKLDGLTGHSHTSAGWPNFEGWPHALSVIHQQMHISWIHRAWQGGLRLMLASVTDNQTLSMLWHRGFSTVGSQPKPNPNFDVESAKRQIQFIRNLARANSSWMEIVETPSQARIAISSGKLALVLSLELDTLDAEQIISLKLELGIRHVIPIHLVDNRFGGAAVYNDLFNASNYYLSEHFYQVTGDPNLEFRLARPQYLAVADGNSVKPKEIEESEYRALGYECFPSTPVPGCVSNGLGHKNVRGLVKTELQKLMAEGLLIDLAHMSDAAQTQASSFQKPSTIP